ncbi:MAG: acetylxylan esterase [Verrucomicrobiae bacterium]|nr:acetylxylan esterase [Verrucomicrobiae bacterium]
MLADYFELEAAKLESACLAGIQTKQDWLDARDGYRMQLLEMLALDPLPPRTPLNARSTGRVEIEGDGAPFSVEKIVFESMPGFYATANLYLPEDTSQPLPTVLYACGHGPTKIDGVSYGNKVSYQHHGAWFARNGYACLILDTVQMGEIEGTHHGTYREGMWWWNSRGYSSAGAEAWNCVRALDYLETRPEVDKERFGVTGRSGGGAYSWWIAAIDGRIKAAVPVAGITTLRNHVVDGCVEGHCDCMYPVNTYRWDFPVIAALVAPRPLLISNSDKDTIFPLNGVYAVHQQTKRIYDLLGASDHLGLQITEGPHKDTQMLRVHAFVWFDRFLKGNDPPLLIDKPAVPFLTPQQLKVLESIPEDERTSKIEETFATMAPAPAVPKNAGEWQTMEAAWMKSLKEKIFRGWPEQPGNLDIKEISKRQRGAFVVREFDFNSQPGVRLPMFLVSPDKPTSAVVVTVMDEEMWSAFSAWLDGESTDRPFEFKGDKVQHVFLAPRGVGPTAWTNDARARVHIRRRFMLLGQTLAGMRAFDIKRGLDAASATCQADRARSAAVHARGEMGVNTLYATLLGENGQWRDLLLTDLPASHRAGPDYLNVLRFLDIPEALAMASQHGVVIVQNDEPGVADYAAKVSAVLIEK